MSDAASGTRSPTLRELVPQDPDEVPLMTRTIDMRVFARAGYHVVIGSLHDRRPWASVRSGPRDVHRMELGIVVRCADLVIVAAEASMGHFPHPECPSVTDSFSELIGLSVARGFTRAVQDRFGRERGCSHLEFLARSLGPVVIQSLNAAAARRMEDGEGRRMDDGEAEGDATAASGLQWLTNTCHIWSVDGIGMQKLAAGWQPDAGEYPAPSLVEIRRRRRQQPG